MINILRIHVNRKIPRRCSMITDFANRCGELLKSLRKERKIARQKLAEAAGVERNYIYYWGRGDSEPTLSVLMGLAQGLGMAFSEFSALIEALPNAPKNIH